MNPSPVTLPPAVLPLLLVGQGMKTKKVSPVRGGGLPLGRSYRFANGLGAVNVTCMGLFLSRVPPRCSVSSSLSACGTSIGRALCSFPAWRPFGGARRSGQGWPLRRPSLLLHPLQAIPLPLRARCHAGACRNLPTIRTVAPDGAAPEIDGKNSRQVAELPTPPARSLMGSEHDGRGRDDDWRGARVWCHEIRATSLYSVGQRPEP